MSKPKTSSGKRFRKGVMRLGFTVGCGKCGSHLEHFPDKKLESKDGAIAKLHKDGWVQTRTYGWVCDTCEFARKEKLKEKKKKKKRTRNNLPF